MGLNETPRLECIESDANKKRDNTVEMDFKRLLAVLNLEKKQLEVREAS